MAEQTTLQTYQAPGPIGAAFIESTFPIPIIMGPGGSGKTVGSAYKGPYLASSWAPVCRDGVIRVKMTVFRNTYRDLARTALQTWHSDRLFPENHPYTHSYTGGIDRPVYHEMRWATVRDKSLVPVHFIAEFGAIGDQNPEQFAKGYETTFGWDNECDTTHERVPGLMFSRTGRYPAVDQIAPAELDRVIKPYRRLMAEIGLKIDDDDTLLPRILWGDCNPPDPDNWVNRWLIEEPEKHRLFKLFRQPGGLAPNAENRIGKPRSRYLQDLETMTASDARRYVHGEIGFAVDGKPVYGDDFNTLVHVADTPLEPAPGLPLYLGLDAGGSPAAGLAQFMPNGQMRMLAELCTDPGTGPETFARLLYELLLSRFRGFPVRAAWSDPSSFYGADTRTGNYHWSAIVAKALNINIEPAPSNEPHMRHEAVRWYLRTPVDGRFRSLLIGSDLRMTIGGFAAHYKISKKNTAGETDRLQVVENKYTHVHDAWQYVALGYRGPVAVIADAAKLNRGANVVPIRGNVTNSKGFDVWAV